MPPTTVPGRWNCFSVVFVNDNDYHWLEVKPKSDHEKNSFRFWGGTTVGTSTWMRRRF